MMYGILIDPQAKTLANVALTLDKKGHPTLEAIYKTLECKYVDQVKYQRHCIVVDDEGLFNNENEFFLLPGIHQPSAGKALLFTMTRAGNWTEPTIGIPELSNLIEWIDRKNMVL